MGFMENRRQRQSLNIELANKLAERTARRARHPELVDSVVGLHIKIIPSKIHKVEAFFKALMRKIGEITESVLADGKLTSRFVIAASEDMEKNPWMTFMCFNRGLEAVEIQIAMIQAQLLALQHGVKISIMESYGQEQEEVARGRDEEAETERRKGRKIVGRFAVPQVFQSYVVDIIVSGKFKALSARAVVYIAREVVIKDIYKALIAEQPSQRASQKLRLERILSNPGEIERLMIETRADLTSTERAQLTSEAVRAHLQELLANLNRADRGEASSSPGFSVQDAVARPEALEKLAAGDQSIQVISEQDLIPDEFIKSNPEGKDYIIQKRMSS